MNIIIHHARENYCPECFSRNLVRDFHHSETFCEDCGLVVRDEVYFMDNSDYINEREKELKKYLDINNNDLESSSSETLTYKNLFDKIFEEIEIKKAEKKKAKKKKNK